MTAPFDCAQGKSFHCAQGRPPRVAEWLLAAALTASERDAVVGDLAEEFTTYIVPHRGELMARWWYRWQVARSLTPLFFRSWERASVMRASVAIIGAAAMSTIPAVLLLMLRAFVLQQVPLKAASELSASFALALVTLVIASAAAGVAYGVRLLRADDRRS